jgi:hypothetical protein
MGARSVGGDATAMGGATRAGALRFRVAGNRSNESRSAFVRHSLTYD